MGSPCEVLIDGGNKQLADRVSSVVATEAWRIEDKFSRYLDGNVIHRINTSQGEPVEVDAETGNLLDFAATLFEISGGRFDITSGVLRAVWTFDGSDNIPAQDDIDKALGRVGWQRATWADPCLTLQPGMEVDLGGIGKEYAVDRCTTLVRSAANVPAMINFGGDLAVTSHRLPGIPGKLALRVPPSIQRKNGSICGRERWLRVVTRDDF